MKEKIKEKSFMSRRFENIKKHFNLNNSQLATIAGVTPTTIRDFVEGDLDNPKLNMIDRICKSLGINYEWFFEENAEFLMSQVEKNGPLNDLERKYYKAVELLAINGIKFDLGKTEGGLIRPYGSFFLYPYNPYVNPPIGMHVHSTPTNN